MYSATGSWTINIHDHDQSIIQINSWQNPQMNVNWTYSWRVLWLVSHLWILSAGHPCNPCTTRRTQATLGLQDTWNVIKYYTDYMNITLHSSMSEWKFTDASAAIVLTSWARMYFRPHWYYVPNSVKFLWNACLSGAWAWSSPSSSVSSSGKQCWARNSKFSWNVGFENIHQHASKTYVNSIRQRLEFAHNQHNDTVFSTWLSICMFVILVKVALHSFCSHHFSKLLEITPSWTILSANRRNMSQLSTTRWRLRIFVFLRTLLSRQWTSRN